MGRRFDGTTNAFTNHVTTGFTASPFGTGAAVVNMAAAAGTGIVGLAIGSSGTVDFVDFINVYNPAVVGYWNSTGASDSKGTTACSANNWVLVAASKATGTVAARVHLYTWTTNVWVHENASVTDADSAATGATTMMVGGVQSGTINPADMAAVAAWNRRVLTDSEIERLPAGQWQRWTPDVLVEYPNGRDFPTSTVTDHSRNQTRQSVLGSGVARSAVADPPGFRFSKLSRRR